MVTRREVVTTGTLGTLAAAAGGATTAVGATTTAVFTGAGGEAGVQSAEQIAAQALREIAEHAAEIRRLVREAATGPSLSHGVLVDIRRQFAVFLRSNQKYPDFCEIGPAVFTDLYDWHVRYQQPIEISRVDNRTAIRFMFTWMILRPEQADSFIGIPFDRG